MRGVRYLSRYIQFHNEHKLAIIDRFGQHSFGQIYNQAGRLATQISEQLLGKCGERVMFLCPNDARYVISLWAIWMSGQIGVPLSPLHPQNLLEYYANDCKSNLLIGTKEFGNYLSKIDKKLLIIDDNKIAMTKFIEPIKSIEDAMILYTSGTTGTPKGVVLTHKNIETQIEILNKSWNWCAEDVMLHTLPLHHIHGTINALFCPLSIGATTVMMAKFNSEQVWENFHKHHTTVFMGVPTIYSKLIDSHTTSCNVDSLRLMVSGSAPLPTPLFDKWFEITGHKLLERYGMTEIGMCLSNQTDIREPGYVGLPLPTVDVALHDGKKIVLVCKNVDDVQPKITTNGELLVKGPSVFKGYYGRPEQTNKEFMDGWFKTGDIAEYDQAKNKFRMLGRQSTDIIKSGGYKLSALQIETQLLAHPDIRECAVLGIQSDTWGEQVAAVVVSQSDTKKIDLENLRKWAKNRIPKYSIPTILKVVKEIPKNAMGKVNKKELNKTLF